MKEYSAIDALLDENNTEPIILFDENNKETEFEQVCVIPLENSNGRMTIYAILKPVTEIVGLNDDEALVFKVEEIEDEDCLVIEDDDEMVNKVFDAYYDLLRAEGIEV
jgi:uncharacterized protein YrzB (UPF0473 family)